MRNVVIRVLAPIRVPVVQSIKQLIHFSSFIYIVVPCFNMCNQRTVVLVNTYVDVFPNQSMFILYI